MTAAGFYFAELTNFRCNHQTVLYNIANETKGGHMLAKAGSFGERLRVARTSRGINQRSLGDMVGVSTISISRYESGAVDPRLGMVRRLAKALGVSAAELAGFDDEEE